MTVEELAKLIRADLEANGNDTSADSDMEVLQILSSCDDCGGALFDDETLIEIVHRCTCIDDFISTVELAQAETPCDSEVIQLVESGVLFTRSDGPGWKRVTMFEGVK